MPYGNQGRLGDRIDPRLMMADYSGFANAGMIKGQALQKMGSDIGNVLKMRSEQKKRDAQNEKFLKQAYEMFQGTELEAPIANAYGEYTSEETTDKQRRAISEAMRETIGLGITAQELKMKQAAMLSKGGSAGAPTIRSFTTPDGGTQDYYWNAERGRWRPVSEIADSFDGGIGAPMPNDVPLDMGASASGDFGVLPSRLDLPNSQWTEPTASDPLLRTPATPEGGWDADPMLDNERAAAIQRASQGRFGYTPPTPQEQWSEPYEINGKWFQTNLGTKETKSLGASLVDLRIGENRPLDAKMISEGWYVDEKNTYQTRPGSPAYYQVEEEKRKAQAGPSGAENAAAEQKSMGIQDLGVVLDSLDQIQGVLYKLDDSPLGAKVDKMTAAVFEGSGVGAIEDLMTTVTTAVGRETVNSLRASSPTGSAGGTITENEWPKFEQRFGKLYVGMNKELMRKNIPKIAMRFYESVNGTPEEVAQWTREGKVTPQQKQDYDFQRAQLQRRYGVKADAPSLFSDEQKAIRSKYTQRSQ